MWALQLDLPYPVQGLWWGDRHQFISFLVTSSFDPLTDGKLWGPGRSWGKARLWWLQVQQRKQLLVNFINTQQSLSWFSSPQGWGSALVALLCAAVFLQDVGKGEGILCLCPCEVKRCEWRRVQAEAGVQEESVWHAWGCTVAEWNQISGSGFYLKGLEQ